MMNEIKRYHFKYLITDPTGGLEPEAFSPENAWRVQKFHHQLPGYQPTELVSLSRLARAWKLKNIFVKDESTRFDLKAFKVLGGSYAVAQLMCQKLGLGIDEVDYGYLTSDEAKKRIGQMTLTTATDGNHGRGIAWAAEQLGQKAVIYMPKNSALARVENIRSHGAIVEVTDVNYDDAVRLSFRMAQKNGWYVIQDTAWEGYTQIPLWIMQGYMTMCAEAIQQMAEVNSCPTHVFLQAGVGALAGAMVGYLVNIFKDKPPKFIIMEPENAACILASAAAGDGKPHAVTGDLDTIMAGLACGEPNTVAWEILRDFSNCYVSCDNFVSANGIRILANPLPGDVSIEAGESGSVGIGVLDLLSNHAEFQVLKQKLEIGPDSSLLFFNTEGATDPVNYREILWHGRYPSIF